jgi:hypothetical protein
MSKEGIPSRRGRKPRTRKVSVRSAAHALAGPEQPYPVYQFSNRIFVERPSHNPFAGIAPDTGNSSWGSSWGDSWGSSWDIL